MKIKRKSLIRKSGLVLILFLLLSAVSFADANSDTFAQVFRDASKQGGSIVGRVVNALYYGMLTVYRGVSLRLSQLCGGVILFFMVINMLKTILQNIDRMDIYSIFKAMLPNLVKNLTVGFILVTPVNYTIKSGIGGVPVGSGAVQGTLFTRFTEMIFTMFYRLGTLFFNDSRLADISPGELADLFMSRPLNLLQDVFGFMTFFAIFTNIAKIILLLLSLWLCSKIIATYIANIFMALMLINLSMFYLMFLTMESTVHIGQKGINIIVVQSVTLFITVAMMGISYQVMNLIAISNSVQGIAVMAVVLFMLQQVMGNISMMAISITSGGGLGTSNGAAFLGLSQALGMMIGGLAMFGGAKMDEFMSKEKLHEPSSSKGKENDKEKRDYILRKARENVGVPLIGESRYEFKNSNERTDKKRKGSLGAGARAGMAASIFMQGMTGNLSDIKTLTGYGKELGNILGNSENNPYNVMSTEQREKEARRLMSAGWKDLWYSMSEIKLSSEAGTMNEGLRISIQNSKGDMNTYERYRKFSEIKEISSYGKSGINMEEYLRYLEAINRNNVNRIINSEEEKNQMIRNTINEYRLRIDDNRK